MIGSVLVVDDDPEFRELAGRLLAAGGLFVVGEAGSVATALAAAVRLEPSAVLVDVELPDGDGDHACAGARGVALASADRSYLDRWGDHHQR